MANTDQRIVLRRIAIGFDATDWSSNDMLVLQAGIPSNPGEIGPHNMPIAAFYATSVYRHMLPGFTKEVGLTLLHDKLTGNIQIIKAALAPAFSGVLFVETF